jgi:hypothetical protein
MPKTTPATTAVTDADPRKALRDSRYHRGSRNEIKRMSSQFSVWRVAAQQPVRLTYFALVFRATSGGRAGAGGCLFQWIDSR